MISIPNIKPAIIDRPELDDIDFWMNSLLVLPVLELLPSFTELNDVVCLYTDCLNDLDIQTINEYTTWKIAPAPIAKKMTEARGE